MVEYHVVLSRSARKELETFPTQWTERIVRHLEALVRSPRPVGNLKLKGAPHWRIRVGDYRIIYAIDDVAYIRHRKDVYRDL